MDAILQAAEQTDCQALHPGFGFLAENALFAARVRQQQIAWVGPSSRAIACMGDKAQARRAMMAAGLPVTPGTDGVLADLGEASVAAQDVGYPVLLKATAGGGGKGMRLCADESELEPAFAEATLEAEKSFGNPGLYLEKAIVGARHIEFQVLGDAFGSAVHLGERECSVQRRHQKLLEEAPSPVIDAEQRAVIGARAAGATAALGYVSAGTMEFLRDADGSMYFMEMNTRLQVEHPVTELITGIDIVEQQLRLAANEPLSIDQKDVEIDGHAIEMRINAEDPEHDFRPDPGLISVFEPPAGDGIRLDSHIRAGYRIPPFYDSMIAKLIVHAPSRRQAIERAGQALAAFRIEGVKTTIPIQKRILSEERFRDGSYDTRWLEEELARAQGEKRG
jgi:acetyl-CoA carboxylase biotin carboxylase subunit